MRQVLDWVDHAPVSAFVILALTLGLAPFAPEPHVWEKLQMLVLGDLVRPIDIFDLFLHGVPWLMLGLKLYRDAVRP